MKIGIGDGGVDIGSSPKEPQDYRTRATATN